jgi:thiamine biosynthesis lipoprotein
VQFAVAVAEETDGAFDPTVGGAMEARGFDRHYLTRERVSRVWRIPGDAPGSAVTYRDVELDAERHTIRLRRPLMLDLGAVAKGLAIDMAARELSACPWFAIDAGGDLFVSGSRPDRRPWTLGIRHPRTPDALITTIHVAGGAVCTSGDYERTTARGHHLLDQRAAGSRQRAESAAGAAGRRLPAGSCSATVVAPNAMLADALATAAFVLGGAAGVRLLERHGVDGLIVTADVECYATAGFSRTYQVLQNAEGTADAHPGAAARDRDPGRGAADRRAGSR